MIKEPERVVSLSDFIFLCRKYKRTIIRGALIGASLMLLYALTRPVEYRMQSTFREKSTGSTSWTGESSLSSLLLGSAGMGDDQEVISVLKSRNLLEKLVAACDLQAVLEKREIKLFPWRTVKDHLQIQLAQLRRVLPPILQKREMDIAARNITYQGELPLLFRVVVYKDDTFQLATPTGIVQGQLGSPHIAEGATFTLIRTVDQPLDDFEYTLSILPMHLAVTHLRSRLTVKEDLDDSTLIRLQYLTDDRYRGARVLNTFMDLYQDYLREEHKRVLTEQIAYLHSRQENMQQHLAAMMKSYADSLAIEMTHSGFPTANDAMAFMAKMQQDYIHRLISIDLDLKGLRSAQHQGTMCLPRCLPEQATIAIKELHQRINQLNQQADLIPLSEAPLVKQQADFEEFQGVDLDLARRLYLEYSKELDNLNSQLLQIDYVMGQMQDPDFEISSLSTLLTDPVSQKMIASASSLVLELQDSENRSNKELDRLREQIQVQKGFLSLHLKQTQHLLGLRKERIQEKIVALQQLLHHLIQKEVAVLRQHLADHLQAGINSLEHEQGIIQQHQVEQHQELAQLPKKWVTEKLIEQEMNINKMMLEELGRLVESKNTLSQLEMVQSTPLDHATALIPPEYNNALLLAGLGGVTGALLVVAAVVVQALMSGLPLSPDNVRLAGLDSAGILSSPYNRFPKPIRDHDLSVLRRLVTLLEQRGAGTVLLFTGEGEDYSRDLAQLISKKGEKVLLLPLHFDQVAAQNSGGLLHYLQGEVESPQIQACEGYDLVSPGGVSRYANELLGTPRFSQLLEQLSDQYDWLFAVTYCSPSSAEGEALLRRFPQSVITVVDQRWPEMGSVMAAGSGSGKPPICIFG